MATVSTASADDAEALAEALVRLVPQLSTSNPPPGPLGRKNSASSRPVA